MRQHLYILAISFLLTACKQSSSTNIDNKATGTANTNKIKADLNQQIKKRLSFKNMSEIIEDSSGNIWVEKQDSNFSLALHFQYKDTLAVSYSPECWLIYPYKHEGNKIIVYWDNYIDTKYDFDIVKTIHQTDKKYLGKAFMILELANDTTFKATYPIQDLIRKINSSSKERTFFPNKFNIVQDGDLYD